MQTYDSYKNQRTVIIDFSAIKDKWLALYNGANWPSQPAFRPQIQAYRKGSSKSGFHGGSPDQMAEWIKNGFSSPEFALTDSWMPQRESRRVIFSEEGELDVGLALSGSDYPFLSYELQKKKPGIRVVADLDFNGGVSAKTIAQYGAWLWGAISGLEAEGYDIELDIATHGTNFSNSCSDRLYHILLRVKRENELIDFSSFSSLFSPTGFRMLMFTAFAEAMDREGLKITTGLGRAVSQKWGTRYDPETGTLYISTDSRGVSFDPVAMTASLTKTLDID